MDLYLTPAQFRNLDLGVDVSGWIDARLAPKLVAASADVNRFCLARDGHSFLGGTVLNETHTWPVDPYATQPRRRVFPYHTPILEVLAFRIYATSSQYLDFANADLYFEKSEGWIEPASAGLTSYGLFGDAVIPWIGLTEPHASLSYTYGVRIAETVRLWYQGNGGYTWRAPSGFWLEDPSEVRIGGQVANPNAYTVDPIEGTITWSETTHPTGTDVVEADVVSTIEFDKSYATGLIVASRISDRDLVEQGFPASLQSIKVAEVSATRLSGRTVSQGGVTIPEEAAELLAPYVFPAVRIA